MSASNKRTQSVSFTESVVEDDALAWLKNLSYTVRYVPDIAPGEPAAEHADHGRVEIDQQLHDSLLPKLISGVLRVSRTDAALKAAS